MANKRVYWRPPIDARLVFAILAGVVLVVVLAGCGRDAVTVDPGDPGAAREIETYFANQGARFVPGIVVEDVQVTDGSRGRTLSLTFVSDTSGKGGDFDSLYYGSVGEDGWTAELNQTGLDLAWVRMEFVYQDGFSETLVVDIAGRDIAGSTRLRPGPPTTRP